MFSSSLLLCSFLLKTVKNKIAQIITTKITLKITIHAISPFLRPLLSDEPPVNQITINKVFLGAKPPIISKLQDNTNLKQVNSNFNDDMN